MATLLAEENGVVVAVDFIYKRMKKHAAVAQLGSLRPPAPAAPGDLGADVDSEKMVSASWPDCLVCAPVSVCLSVCLPACLPACLSTSACLCQHSLLDVVVL